MSIREKLAARTADLAPAELRVAEAILARPEAIAFGTVAELAKQATASGATVIRLAIKLGYGGFVGLQQAAQQELAERLNPAVVRIHHTVSDDVLAEVGNCELRNLQATLNGVDRSNFEKAVGWLSDVQRHVVICPGDGSRGAGYTLGDQLLALRPDVSVTSGNTVSLGRELASLEAEDVLVVLDVRRYDRLVVHAAELVRVRGTNVISITDSQLGPVSRLSNCALVAHADAVGPFDSQIGALALGNALVAAAADRLRAKAAPRLERIEEAWQQMQALSD